VIEGDGATPAAAPPPLPTSNDFDRRDLVGLAGVFLLGLGFAFVWPPLGLIVPGAILTAIAVFGVRGQ
jgi:hypothetical protein